MSERGQKANQGKLRDRNDRTKEKNEWVGLKGKWEGWKTKTTGMVLGRKPQSSETCLNIFGLAET